MENNELSIAYAEVYEILSFMEPKYIDKIPLKLMELFREEKLKDYKPNIEPTIPLDEQKLQKKTLIILAMLNINYWCEDENEKKMLHIEAIIQSMTQEERRKPSIIGASRKVRISKGSGTRVQDVNQLLKQFEQMQKMMKQLSGGRQAKMLKRLRKRK